MPEPLTDPRWFVLAGVVLVVMAIAASVLRRLPVTASILYLLIGVAVGPLGLGLIRIDPLADAPLLELLTEIAVIVSLFTAGLKLREPLQAGRWRRPVRLATFAMIITIALVAAVGVGGLGFPLGVALLLGATLAPTDPVLASDVQVTGPTDLEDLRFNLTGEAGLNDGSAFPFVLLALGVLGLHEVGDNGMRWLVVDLAWASIGGLAIGGLAGTLVARLVLHLRRTHRTALGLDEFLGLGLIALSYGVALLAGTYGFLAVFAAGLAVRRIELLHTGEAPADPEVVEAPERAVPPEEAATHPERAPAYMASTLLAFNEQLERILEIGLVVLLGAMLAVVPLPGEVLWFAPLLFLVIRPLSVVVGLVGTGTPPLRLAYLGWFGIRGIGSLYYLMYAIVHGLPVDQATRLAGIVLAVVAVSIVVHGVSVTPLMDRYDRLRARRSPRGTREASTPGGSRPG
jgi:NhaP-type Na+/H+ or K+/H+ antiporter